MRRCVLDIELGSDRRGYLSVDILGVPVKGLLDCASSRTLVGEQGMKTLVAAGLQLQESRYTTLRVANKGTTQIVGEFIVPFTVAGKTRVIDVLYVPLLSTALILGLDFWRRYHLIPDFVTNTCSVDEVELLENPPEVNEPLSDQQKEDLQKLLQEFSPLLDPGRLGCVKGVTHHIDTGDSPPIKARLPLKWVQVIPRESREELIRACHDDATSGHGGWYRTFERIRQEGYWPGMKNDVKRYVELCQVCQRVKVDRRRRPGFMSSKEVVSRPIELLAADLIGPLPRSSKGHTAISVITDAFSKYVYIRPVRVATAAAVTAHLYEDVILKHGAPRAIQVDNGQQYRSKVFQALCQTYNIKIRYNIAYNPRTNFTERMNQTLETLICSYVQENHRKWDVFLPEIQTALNTSASHVTGVSPHQVIFGESLILDGREREYDGAEDPQILDPEPLQDSAINEKRQFYEELKEKIRLAKQRYASRYNLRRRPHQDFQPGCMVLRRNFVKSNKADYFSKKLASKWIGPYKVKARVGRVSYLLEDEQNREDGPWHVEQLKLHRS
ncbi:hypothetical protein FOCC_FOCC013620 [Frankliniella occidentalis]|nr:hypothetical protein FOCC_FOCC013620 [Frankliniella occidentalis]